VFFNICLIQKRVLKSTKNLQKVQFVIEKNNNKSINNLLKQSLFANFFVNMKKSLLLWVIVSLLLLCWCDKNTNIQNIETWENNSWVISEIDQDIQNVEIEDENKMGPSIPDRVLWLNITEPEWLNFVSSQETQEWADWYDSFRMIYSWNYDQSIDQAKKIANQAWIPVNSEFQWAQNVDSQLADLIWGVQWALYTNYTLSKNPDSKYMITISVDEDWILEIELIDWKKQNEINS